MKNKSEIQTPGHQAFNPRFSIIDVQNPFCRKSKIGNQLEVIRTKGRGLAIYARFRFLVHFSQTLFHLEIIQFAKKIVVFGEFLTCGAARSPVPPLWRARDCSAEYKNPNPIRQEKSSGTKNKNQPPKNPFSVVAKSTWHSQSLDLLDTPHPQTNQVPNTGYQIYPLTRRNPGR